MVQIGTDALMVARYIKKRLKGIGIVLSVDKSLIGTNRKEKKYELV